MGTIQQLDRAREFALSARTRVGRYPENDLVLDADHVSGHHALVEWGGEGQWLVKDLGSTNGTFIDGALLGPGEQRSAKVGAVIAFGDPEHGWRLIDDARPQAEAVDVSTGERVIAEHQLLVLGDAAGRSVVLEERPGAWVLEMDGTSQPARDAQQVVVADRKWMLRLPICLPSTTPMKASGGAKALAPLGGARFHFVVSKDLEHVELQAEHAGKSWVSERTYVRILIELAKVRLRDAAREDLHPDDQGWIYADELCRASDIDGEERLNVEIHRARKDMGKHGIDNGASIVQRRRGTKQLRIGTDLVSVELL
jgi:hypothetical protein